MNPLTVASEPTAQTAGDPPAPCSLLRMAVGDEMVAVGIEDVREILQMTRLTPLPRTPDFVRGVMNLRGAVVPVVDLAAPAGPRAHGAQPPQLHRRRRIPGRQRRNRRRGTMKTTRTAAAPP